MLQRELFLFLEILEFRICLILHLQWALSPRPEALDSLEAQSPMHAMTV